MSQSIMKFPEPPLQGNVFIEKLTEMLVSLASSRAGTNPPADVQDGEIWVKIEGAAKSIMLRHAGADIPIKAAASAADTLNGMDSTSMTTPAAVKSMMDRFGLFGASKSISLSDVSDKDIHSVFSTFGAGFYYTPSADWGSWKNLPPRGGPYSLHIWGLNATRQSILATDMVDGKLYFKRCSDTWGDWVVLNPGAATAVSNGLMSYEDKQKLDSNKFVWTGPESSLPASRDANTLYYCY